jgi:hypothetical protein
MLREDERLMHEAVEGHTRFLDYIIHQISEKSSAKEIWLLPTLSQSAWSAPTPGIKFPG